MNDLELAEVFEDNWRIVAEFFASRNWPDTALGRAATDINDRAPQIIAALRRGPERPPSDEMVEQIVRIVLQLGYNHWLRNGTAIKVGDAPLVLLDVRPMLSAEAEGRKPCPLCGRTEPHSHTSGPLGIS